MSRVFTTLFLTIFLVSGCQNISEQPKNTSLAEVAGNEDVKQFMEAFEGRGDQSDDAPLTPPKQTLENFQISDDLEIDLLLAEPQIHQPVEVNFDHRGRLWVVQYNQYPYPKGLKVVDIDHHIRAVFDKKPQAPPNGQRGADKITIFEDTNGDGSYDKATDAIQGLNIATSVTLGRGKIWVLTPPYLVAYPDPDGDGLPNGDPEVHLDGFGLEDTHAVANSLRWGPDGWLYGAQGSTTHATINSAASKDVHFKGQAFWRYHPTTKIFEVYAEGGGNTFHVEIDRKGRFYSGTNGTYRGLYHKQGGYYHKNWGKHGALTNPYALGFLPGMDLEGEKIRFTHAWVKYEGGSLPDRYNDKIIAVNPLLNYVQLTRLEPKGSTFSTIDETKILETGDNWFRPVDIKVGPDGGVYLADWSDSRLSHVDPRDTWNKTTGRIYRLCNKNKTSVSTFDLSTYTNQQLVQLLTHENKWFRQQALRLFGDRQDASILPDLMELFRTGDNQAALEALWAINLSGGFNDQMALEAIKHGDPYVRSWAVRLVGDDHKASKMVADQLAELAASETQLEVLGQLASTAKRLPGTAAILIIDNLLKNELNSGDQDNELFIWWAVESKAETDRERLLALFKDADLWSQALIKEVILERLMQRYAHAGGKQNYAACVQLFNMAPAEDHAKLLLNGLQEGLRGRDVSNIGEALAQKLQYYQGKFGEGELAYALRQNETIAVNKALEVIVDEKANSLERLSYIHIFGKIDQPKAIPELLKIASNNKYAIGHRIAAIQALRHYEDSTIGEQLANAYPDQIRANLELREAALNLFASRAPWANQLLEKISTAKQVKRGEVPISIVRQFKLLEDSDITTQVEELWPHVKVASSEEKSAAILKIKQALKNGSGQIEAGKSLYSSLCGNCHQLFGEGANIGPDLTGYDRNNINYLTLNIVDPNADIREGYVNYLIEKKDGQIVVGIISDRSAGTVTVRPIGGEEVSLPTDQIKDMTAQTTSIMPERLLESLSDQQIRDLFAYIGK